MAFSLLNSIIPTSWAGLGLLSLSATSIYAVYYLAFAIYYIYFHPLSNFPGPKLWISFPIIHHIASARGVVDEKIREFHNKYGEVVRFAPFELSFINADAWKDIYGHQNNLQKWEYPTPPGIDPAATYSIISANEVDHARYRKAMAPGFSERALRDQEPIVKGYVDLMIEKLTGVAESGMKTDMAKWYNLATFDIIGDLSMGASFGGLNDSEYHAWVDAISKIIKLLPFLRILGEYPNFTKFIMSLVPKSLMKARGDSNKFIREAVIERISNEKQHGRGDFIDPMLKNRGKEGGLTDVELFTNCGVLVVAGSETSATLLAGVTYWLLRTPDTLRRVTEEVRSAFHHEAEITFASIGARLPYLLACIEEGLRIYPPVPSGLPRWSHPEGPTKVGKYTVPPDTAIMVHMSAAFWSPTNFHDPLNFHPERWLNSTTNDPSSPFYNDDRAVLNPFGIGHRNCIGRTLADQEMRLILTRILWHFDLELCEESRRWNVQKVLVHWLKGPLMCKLRVRDMGR